MLVLSTVIGIVVGLFFHFLNGYNRKHDVFNLIKDLHEKILYKIKATVFDREGNASSIILYYPGEHCPL